MTEPEPIALDEHAPNTEEGPSLSPFVPAGADEAFDIGFHDKLKNRRGDGAAEISLLGY
jgi:hypothetical protein